MTQPPISEVVCASCGHPGTGRFCSNCGAPLTSTVCTSCGSPLSPGARFCHRCGAGVGKQAMIPQTSAQRTSKISLPLVVGGIALVMLLAYLAGGAFSSRPETTRTPLSEADGQGGGPAQQGIVRAPDISQLSPEESADRLYKRVMLLDKQGKSDSVLFFAPMAIDAYRMLNPMNIDQRYDLGRVAEVAGDYPLARAQADTILRESPSHLLGLVLAMRIASAEKKPGDKAAYESKLRSAYAAEIARKLPEYERHEDDIRNAMSPSRAPAAK